MWETVEPYRKNERVILLDPLLANLVWNRVAKELEKVSVEPEHKGRKWRTVGVDSNLRYVGFLRPHRAYDTIYLSDK